MSGLACFSAWRARICVYSSASFALNAAAPVSESKALVTPTALEASGT